MATLSNYQLPGKSTVFSGLNILIGIYHSWFINFLRFIIQKQINIKKVIKILFLINQKAFKIYLKYIWSLVIWFLHTVYVIGLECELYV